MQSNRIGGRRGFTLIELLIVILILAILMAVALPLYLGSLAKSESTTCRSNMWSIAQAEQAYRTRGSAHVYTTSLTNLYGDLGSTPTCPNGGTYTVSISDGTTTAGNGQTVQSGGLVITCSVSSHGTYAPGVDSQ